MKTTVWVFAVFLAALSGASAQVAYPVDSLGRGRLIFEKSQQELELEVASTPAAKARGLMFRETLPENAGMIFVYKKEQVLGVWMKNTEIPLDILFISPKGKIVSILQNVQPCITPVCGVYDSRVNALYMLEVNAGTVDRYQIEIGDRVLIDLELESP